MNNKILLNKILSLAFLKYCSNFIFDSLSFKMNQFSSPFQNKSTVFICIYSLGVLALLPHTHFFFITL